eukprot:4864568-Prymnesium_polylepis.1
MALRIGQRRYLRSSTRDLTAKLSKLTTLTLEITSLRDGLSPHLCLLKEHTHSDGGQTMARNC